MTESDPSEFTEYINAMKAIPPMHGYTRKRYLDSLPREFWAWLMETHGSVEGIRQVTGLSKDKCRERLEHFGISRDKSHRDGRSRDIDKLVAELTAKLELVYPEYDVPDLGADKVWAIAADVHIPTTSPLWLRRFLAVCEAEQVDQVLIAGDFGNWDALSRFALKSRGGMVAAQEEVDLMRDLLDIFSRAFSGATFMLTNHEMRPIARLASELKATDFFEHILEGGKYVDRRMVDIGQIRFIHPDRGRKVRGSQANEYTMRYGKSCYVAHSHRFDAGQAHNGLPCGMLGGLFWKERMGYYATNPGYVEWENGFWVYREGRMIPFADSVGIDWSKYGVE